jgi:coenzyme F420-0:L-glutamate ligase / coenzyme F420-1:gamma-L-glutamate ligase
MRVARSRLEAFAISGLPEVRAGDDLGLLLVEAMAGMGELWKNGDILVVAQKVVSKAEGRLRRLADIVPGDRAYEISAATGKDPRKVQAVLDESSGVVRVARTKAGGVIIARHRAGWVCANAGIDESNLGSAEGDLLLLPLDPDVSARRLSDTIERSVGVRPAVIVTDTFGRPWRRGLVNVALGLDGVQAIVDLIGTTDAYGRPLQVTQQAFADEIAAASGLLMPKSAGLPAVVMRGLPWLPHARTSARDYVRPLDEDMFQ